MTTSSSALTDALQGEEPTPGGEGGEGGRRHEEILSVTVPPMVTISPMGELIPPNETELERWDAYNKRIFSVLFLSIKGAANSLLVCFAGRPESRQQPNGQVAWKALTQKYLNFSMQRRRVLMRKLSGMVITPNQDPDEYLLEVVQQGDELEHIGESFTEAYILDITRESLSDEYEFVRFTAEWDPEISLNEIATPISNMYANRVARGGGSSFLRGKGSVSAMTESGGS